MARCSNPETVLTWQQRLAQFQTADLSVTQFCQREGVSTATFYRWRGTQGGRS